MAKQILNIGSSADDGTGTTIRAGGDLINDNFNEIYTELGNGSALAIASKTQTLTNKTITGLKTSTMANQADLTFGGDGEVLGLPANPSEQGSAVSKAYVNAQLTGSVSSSGTDYLRKNFVKVAAGISGSSTASFEAVTASAPTGMTSTSENDFILEDLHEKNNNACEIKFKPTIKSQLGIGLVWLKVPPNGEPMYRDKITLKQLMHRVNTYHRPYHKILKNILDNTYKKFGNFYHVNAHSMQNQATAMSDQSQGTKRPDFVIGDREGTSCKRRFTDLIVDFLKSLNYSVDVNYPYKGMELIRAYSDPLQNKNSVQIEVNRKLYMNEETREKIDNFKILKQDLKKLINEIKKQYDEGYL